MCQIHLLGDKEYTTLSKELSPGCFMDSNKWLYIIMCTEFYSVLSSGCALK
jgi:hypothetical protein